MHCSSAVISKARPSASTFVPPAFLVSSRRRESTRPKSRNVPEVLATLRLVRVDQVRNLFVAALASASSRHHDRKPKRSALVNTQHNTNIVHKIGTRKDAGLPQDAAERHALLPRRYSRDDLLGLVDFYDTPKADNTKSESKSNDPGASSSSNGNSHRSGFRDNRDDIALVETLHRFDDMLHDDSSTPESIFAAYKKLPGTGLSLLTKQRRRYLLKRLSVTEYKTAARTLAYFAVLDDYRKIRLSIPIHAWNTAIHLGSTTLHQITHARVEFALKTWKQMEYEAGIPGSEVTFNILFDIATKAGKFNLAEMVLKEMNARKLELTRFTRFGMILYRGLRGDGDQVRQAYRDFVNAHELVDTAVLNCVIRALMAAGEPDAAHSVFERMKAKDLEQENRTYVPKLWSKQRELGSILQYMAHHARSVAAASTAEGQPGPRHTILEGMQDMISIAPDVRTYNILLRYYCAKGELSRTVDVLESMQQSRIQPNDKVFRDLFMGFAMHGTERFSAWSAVRLENVWKSLVRMLQEDNIIINDGSTLLVIRALIAVNRVIGPNEASKVYDVLRSFWTGTDRFEDIFWRPSTNGNLDESSYDIPIDPSE